MPMSDRIHRIYRIQRRPHPGRKGMTLVEIMIVLAILSLIMTAVGFGGFNALNQAKHKQTRLVMRQVQSALVRWQADASENCPGALTELVTKKYMDKEPKDGWGHPFVFKCPGDHDSDVDLVSMGKDGKEGTEDDIKSWEEEKTGDKKP